MMFRFTKNVIPITVILGLGLLASDGWAQDDAGSTVDMFGYSLEEGTSAGPEVFLWEQSEEFDAGLEEISYIVVVQSTGPDEEDWLVLSLDGNTFYRMPLSEFDVGFTYEIPIPSAIVDQSYIGALWQISLETSGAENSRVFIALDVANDSDLTDLVDADVLIHLDADSGVTEENGIVTAWQDLSANGYLFTLNRVDTDSGNDPILLPQSGNGQASIQFDGSDVLTSIKNIQLFQTPNEGLTAFVVAKTLDVSSQRFLLTHNLDTSAGFENFELGYDTGNGSGVGNFGLHRGNFEASVVPENTINAGELVLTTIEINSEGNPPGNIRISKNGGELLVVNDNAGWLAAGSYRTDLEPLDVGARFDRSENVIDGFHYGEISEIVIYRGSLSSVNRSDVEDSLLDEYGIFRSQSDRDGDGVVDSFDNCPGQANADQLDANNDNYGDVCVAVDSISQSTITGENLVVGAGTMVKGNVRIGDNVTIGENVVIEKGNIIGSDVSIGNGVVISKDSEIGDRVFIGSDATIGKNAKLGNDIEVGERSTLGKSVVVGDASTIGTNAIVQKDVVLGVIVLIDDNVTVRKGTFIPDGGAVLDAETVF